MVCDVHRQLRTRGLRSPDHLSAQASHVVVDTKGLSPLREAQAPLGDQREGLFLNVLVTQVGKLTEVYPYIGAQLLCLQDVLLGRWESRDAFLC